MKEAVGEKSLDPQLWQACAGGMVNIPPVNSKVFYFPQGHAEHSHCHVDFPGGARIPGLILCRVASVRFLADPDTDEVFAKIRLVPLDLDPEEADDDDSGGGGEKPASFAKTLTQSDANNGGGFSVPRYCAETIFPRLDYAADPPVQNVVAKDVHGGVWKFRHIYRGTPRRHLLTTGWSNFVNHKKLLAGDSIVFLRSDSGDICVGIRRAKRCGAEWGGLLRAEPVGKVRAEAVVEAAARAAAGRAFEVAYHPRLSTPEFCVKASAVRAAMRVHWWPGMRFKMAFETEDSSRISWFMGTVAAVQVADPVRWAHSPWRLLQVAWDEPDLLHNVKRVNPWLVEPASHAPSCSPSPSPSPPMKKLRWAHPPPFFAGLLGPNPNPNPNPNSHFTTTPAGIQGARHALFGISLSDPHHHNHWPQPIPAPIPIVPKLPEAPIPIVPTVGTDPASPDKKRGRRQFVLFGQPILTEQQISEAGSEHCKPAEDVGRTLDLAALGSYEELHRRLAAMFGIDRSEIQSHVLYHDAAGVLKRAGDEPFSDFVKTAKSLTILTDSGSKNVGRTWITGMRNAENGLGASSKTGPLSIFA